MSQLPPNPYDHETPQRAPRRRVWLWVLVITGGVVILGCAGCLGGLAWFGSRAPDTGVYAGNEVPARFRGTMSKLGALDPDEQILFFYSQGVMGIDEGFSYVSDSRVVVYAPDAEPSLMTIPFDEIRTVELYRETSFFIDSEIALELMDGTPVSFPVSSDASGDVRFYEAIEQRVPARE